MSNQQPVHMAPNPAPELDNNKVPFSRNNKFNGRHFKLAYKIRTFRRLDLRKSFDVVTAVFLFSHEIFKQYILRI